ncbi:MAG: helix-turn-helix domain-containing protein [Flammeovirgaceae bacterium]
MQELLPYILGLGLLIAGGIPAFFFLKKSRKKLTTSPKLRLLNQEDSLLCFQKLSNYVAQRSPYLETSISLKDLAARMELPYSYLQQAINDHANGNYEEFINQFRVEKAKELLHAADYKGLPMLQISTDAGFNDLTKFDQVFKKQTGLTPIQYQKKKQ